MVDRDHGTASLARRAAALLGTTASGERILHGGDLSSVLRLDTRDGRRVVAKAGPRVAVEARMLGAMAAAGAPAPAVLAVGDGVFVMEDLGADEGPGGAWADLGAVLRGLHGATGETCGWPEDYAFGPVAIPNGPMDDWPAFWAERRLLPSCAAITADLACRVEALAARLPDLLPRHPRPALLHGDLWSGNVMARGGRVIGLIDPACYYGDPEVDLAMLSLFGSPSPALQASYGPLDPGWETRRSIYQLWPALVHLRLFGAGYRGLVARCLDAAG